MGRVVAHRDNAIARIFALTLDPFRASASLTFPNIFGSIIRADKGRRARVVPRQLFVHFRPYLDRAGAGANIDVMDEPCFLTVSE